MKCFLIIAFLFLQGCGIKCKGVYTETDDNGNLKKYNEVAAPAGMTGCVTGNVALSNWEASSVRRAKGAPCVPQPQFTSRTLISANNWYDYRNGKIYLNLNASTGTYQRLTFGEDKKGKPLYTKLEGCFYQRTADGVDAKYGKQLLLDTQIDQTASTDVFSPMEIFQYSETSSEMNMTRFDDTSSWSGLFCPELSTQNKYCSDLRSGNLLYYPNLTAAQSAELLNEALLIRTQFLFSTVSKSRFDQQWANPGVAEADRADYHYDVTGNVDTPKLTSISWRDFLIGVADRMPTVTDQKSPQCYSSKKNITYPDGSTGSIMGETCLISGVWVFNQN